MHCLSLELANGFDDGLESRNSGGAERAGFTNNVEMWQLADFDVQNEVRQQYDSNTTTNQRAAATDDAGLQEPNSIAEPLFHIASAVPSREL
jgi:hypothetical protein